MIRILAEILAFFAAPFALYFLWLIARLANPFAVDRWTRRVLLPLLVAGLAATIFGQLALGALAPRSEGGYVPAHLENGRIVPGRMQ